MIENFNPDGLTCLANLSNDEAVWDKSLTQDMEALVGYLIDQNPLKRISMNEAGIYPASSVLAKLLNFSNVKVVHQYQKIITR